MLPYENTFNSIHKMKKEGLLKIEFSILGVPKKKIEDTEKWLNDFNNLRNKLAKKYGIGIFESIQFCESLKF